MEKERKKIRLTEFDYGSKGCYFLTICSYNRKAVFSRITFGDEYKIPVVGLTKIGVVIQQNILHIPQVYSGVVIENYVIMPNHVHLLITINEESKQECRTKMLIPKIIQSFKSSVTKEIPIEHRPIWQARYYDHVVRDFSDFQIKWQYIENNPVKWIQDRYYYDGCANT